MDFIKRHANMLITLVFFLVLPFFNVDNIFLSLLVFIFLFPFTKRKFIAKALFFLDVIYFILLAGLVLLSLIAPGIFEDALYVGLVVTVWSWAYSFIFSGIIDGDMDDSKKARIFYYVLLIGTPFVCSAVCGLIDGSVRVILNWVVGLATLSSLIALFGLFRVGSEGSGSSGGLKTASLSLIENVARNAAAKNYCEVIRVQKDGGNILVVLGNARDSYGWSNVAKNVMNDMAKSLQGYDIHNIKIAY